MMEDAWRRPGDDPCGRPVRSSRPSTSPEFVARHLGQRRGTLNSSAATCHRRPRAQNNQRRTRSGRTLPLARRTRHRRIHLSSPLHRRPRTLPLRGLETSSTWARRPPTRSRPRHPDLPKKQARCPGPNTGTSRSHMPNKACRLTEQVYNERGVAHGRATTIASFTEPV